MCVGPGIKGKRKAEPRPSNPFCTSSTTALSTSTRGRSGRRQSPYRAAASVSLYATSYRSILGVGKIRADRCRPSNAVKWRARLSRSMCPAARTPPKPLAPYDGRESKCSREGVGWTCERRNSAFLSRSIFSVSSTGWPIFDFFFELAPPSPAYPPR